jgi:hypothetical protein
MLRNEKDTNDVVAYITTLRSEKAAAQVAAMTTQGGE